MSGENRPAIGDFPAGARIAGYQVKELIGRGGMAVVYRAADVRLDRQVALKVLAPELTRDAAFRQRFIRESRSGAAVDHPNIIPVFEAGEAEGVLFIAMRYVAGRDVRALIDREGTLRPSRVVSIVTQVASALDAAHALGLVHRDVKPANMLLGTIGTGSAPDHVYLSDFGLSKLSVAAVSLTGTGQFPAHREETYAITADDLYLAGTAEVALVGFHSDEMLDHKSLPIRYAGISPCFRREAGSAGRDVRGLLRVHQFEKVEQFVICAADAAESDHWHEQLLGTAEELLQGFGLAYEVVECSTGDMGAGKYRMNDINTWMPSLGAYRETHSCSSLHDWQARRAGIRYKDADGTVRFAYTLNNTAVATPRILAALVENFQTSEAQVRVPAVLRPYLGGRELL